MNLNILPKDMLIELIFKIQEDVEKDYEYYVISKNYDETDIKMFTEKELKTFLIKFLIDRKELIVEIQLDLKNYIDSLENKYNLEDLFEMFEKVEINNPYFISTEIIKAKKVAKNVNLSSSYF